MRVKFIVSLISVTSLSACGGGGGKSSTPPPPPVVDTTAPDTTIDSKPAAATTSNTATFAFSASEAGATLETSLDGAAYAAATSPMNLTGLAAGTHTFSVRARDAAGNVDPSPATYTWGVDLVPPSARIVFPTPTSYSDATSISVRGNANDAFGVSSVSVNGVAAASTDGFQTWSAVVPLTTGRNSLVVSATDKAGNVASNATVATVWNRGPINYFPRGIAFDPAGGRVIAGDGDLNRLNEYRLDNGYSHVLSPTPGAADGRYGIADMTIDVPRNRAIIVDYYADALVAIDLATGARNVVAPSIGNTPQTKFDDGDSIALDAAHNRAFVTNKNYGCVIGVDLATGVRTIVTGDTVGIGPGLSGASGIVYDDATPPNDPMDPPITPRLLVGQGNTQGLIPGIVAVDLATGDRTSFFEQWPNSTGFFPNSPKAFQLDSARQRLYVFDVDFQSIVAIDLKTGNRTFIAGAFAGGTGPSLSGASGLALDPNGHQLYALTYNQIVSIDLTYQQRSVLASMNVGRGVDAGGAESLVIEQASGTAASLLLATRGYGSLVRLDLASGERTNVSYAFGNVGSGPSIQAPGDVALDTRTPSNGRSALVIQGVGGANLLSVDLTNGNRTKIADLDTSAPPVRNIRGMRLDAGRNRVLFTDTNYNGDNALYALDLATGARSTIMHTTRDINGSGIYTASNLVLDSASNPTRAFIADYGLGGIYSVDLASGTVSAFIAPWAGVNEPGDNIAGGMFVDTRNSRLIASRLGTVNNVTSMALATGTQQIVSGEDPATMAISGNGPPLYYCFGFDANATDNVAFASCGPAAFAVDLISGDRVIVAR